MQAASPSFSAHFPLPTTCCLDMGSSSSLERGERDRDNTHAWRLTRTGVEGVGRRAREGAKGRGGGGRHQNR